MYVGRWRVPAANSKKLEEMFHTLIIHLKSNPQRYPQLQSAVICSSAGSEPSEENWMWVEEYANREAYEAFYKALDEDKTFLEIHDQNTISGTLSLKIPSRANFTPKGQDSRQVNRLLVNIVRWRVPQEDIEKHLEFMRWWMDWQRSHPEKFYYTRSRLFTFTEEGSSEENWMFLDEYEDRAGYEKWMKTVHEDPELSKMADEFFPKWDTLIAPKSRKSEVWTEVEKLRVEFKKPVAERGN